MNYPKKLLVRVDRKQQILDLVGLMLENHGSVNISVKGGANAYKLDPQKIITLTSN